MKYIKNTLCIVLALLITLGAMTHVTFAKDNPFADVEDNSWFSDAVDFVHEKGWMIGTTETEFSPSAHLNRAMFVTILHRVAGSPEVTSPATFTDVPEDTFYSDAVSWAYKYGITSGTSDVTFSPSRNITREEMVTFLFRYAKHAGLDSLPRKDLSHFADQSKISEYAKEAFSWAVATKLVQGVSDNTLAPQGVANRAQIAMILYRADNLAFELAPPIEANVVMNLVVRNGVATDIVTGKTFPGITVDGEYMKAGTVTLPKSYSNWTYQMIADYNEESKAGIIKNIRFWSNSGKYEECDNVFRLNEISSISSRGSIRVPWVKDSWNHGYSVTVPVQMHAHVSTSYECLPSDDIFWSFSMDSDNGTLASRINGGSSVTTMSQYTDAEGNIKYVDKIFPASFTLTGEHCVKEIKFYDRPLTAEEQEAAYIATGIMPPNSGINEVVNGIEHLGSSLYFEKDKDGNLTFLESEKKVGTYTVYSESGLPVTYTISEFVQPDMGIDNTGYQSVHITNEPETMDVGKQYPLTAYPYPFNILNEDGKASAFDVRWESSDTNILVVIDGLLIAKAPGTAEITATLFGTEMSDTVTVTVIEPEKIEDNPWYVPADYTTSAGDTFSDTDYASTTRAIYAAIDEAKANGYNHIVFPAQDFYAVPITDEQGYAVRYYVPSNMTIEFPEGSVFHMMDNEVSRGDPTKIEIHYFEFGVGTGDYTESCENSHLIVDTYYGERYNTTHKETEFLEEMRFVNLGRKAINCSVEVRNAYSTTGYFIVVDGVSSTNKKTGVMKYGDFVSGWLDENGEIQESEYWISTSNFIEVPNYGTDGYFISADGQDSYAGKYWGGCAARQYDILWYDADKNLICEDRFQGRGEYYDIPENAAYFKVSLQQSALPVPGTNETMDSPWIAMHDDGAAKNCEIKNTKVFNSACGIFSVVGQTDGLWVHDCYTNRDGMKPYNERTGDFENGWTAMRHSVVSNCFLNGYFGNPGGFNTFFHTNFITNYSGFSGETEMLRYINNTTDYVEVSEKSQAHIYNNTLLTIAIDRFGKSIGHIHSANNVTGEWVRSY